MKYCISIFLFMVIIIRSYSQIDLFPHGTLIIAVICKDGILLAADSRGCFVHFDSHKKEIVPYAYTERARKIYPLGKFKVGISGKEEIKGTYYWDLFEEYNKLYKANDSIEIEFKRFKEFVEDKLNLQDSAFIGEQFIVVGYENKTPTAYSFDFVGTGNHKSTKIGTRLQSLNCSSDILMTIPQNNYQCDYVVKVLGKAFNHCSENDIGVGGKTNIIQITIGNKSKELSKVDYVRYKNYNSFLESILDNKTKVYYVDPEMEETFKKAIKQRLNEQR